MDYLIVVDMQNDFIDGALGTNEAQRIIPRVHDKIASFPGQVIFTMDTHDAGYLGTQEGALLPVPHCLHDTHGWRLASQLAPLAQGKNALTFEKPTFGSVELAEYLREQYEHNAVSSIELIGLCTDICVVSNALLLKAFLPEVPISVDAACCAGVTPEQHRAALETMESCQVLVENN